jgi:hypothetical protein
VDPRTQAYLYAEVRRRIGADGALIMAVFALALSWLLPVGTVLGIAVFVLRARQLRLISWYDAYFPHGCPDRRTLDLAWALALLAVVISVAAAALLIVLTVQQGWNVVRPR